MGKVPAWLLAARGKQENRGGKRGTKKNPGHTVTFALSNREFEGRIRGK